MKICFALLVIRQRAYYFDLILREELGQASLARQQQDGQVAAVDYVPASLSHLLHKPSEMRVQLRRAACYIDLGNTDPVQGAQTELEHRALHDFSPVRSRVYMAMRACLVAKFAHVDLENFDLRGLERQAVPLQFFLERRNGNALQDLELRPCAGQRALTLTKRAYRHMSSFVRGLDLSLQAALPRAG